MPEDPPAGAQAGPDDADLPKPSPADAPLPRPEVSRPEPVAQSSDPVAQSAEPVPLPADPWQHPTEPTEPPQQPSEPPPATAGMPPATVGMPPALPGVPPATAEQPTEPLQQPTEPYAWQVPAPPPARPRRRNRMVFVTSGLLLALLALLVVPLVIDSGDDGSPGGGNRGSAPAAVPAASPEQYQLALTSLDSALTTGWRKLSAARTPATVRNAADALALTVQSEAEKLRGMTPPDQVAAAHGELVSALEELSAGLSSGSTENVCSGSSATPRLSRGAALNQVRTAAQALGAADPAHPYRVGTWVPKVTKDPKRRLTNGKYIKRTMSSGAGQLKIKNGGGADGVVSIVAGNGKPAIVVYVRGKQNFTVRGIRDGSYHVFLSTGSDWDAAAKTFSRDCAFERFDDAFKFRTTSTTYTIWEITVQAVSGGNATATSVSPDDFPIG
jgi:hypothetical protein